MLGPRIKANWKWSNRRWQDEHWHFRNQTNQMDWTGWISTIVGKNPQKKWSSHHSQQKSLKCSTWIQSQKWQNDLCSLLRQTFQHHSNPGLCPEQECWRSWSWTVLQRPTRPSRTNTRKRCPFHHRGLECKSKKSRDTWSNRQIWPWSTEWSRAKSNNSFAERVIWS